MSVSTEEQAEEGVSLDDVQGAKMKCYAELYNIEIVELIEDPGVSGKSLKRDGLQRALEMLRNGEAEGLLIYKLDRLTRSISDWQYLIDNYFGEKAGKQLLSVSDSIDTRTAAGRLVLNVLITVAQWERETIGERTRDALRAKIKKGHRVGSILYGFDVAEDETTLIPNPGEQQIIQLMHELRNAGQSLREAAPT
jgi:DNA invertase Pin-like site-specific DNA recombinase